MDTRVHQQYYRACIILHINPDTDDQSGSSLSSLGLEKTSNDLWELELYTCNLGWVLRYVCAPATFSKLVKGLNTKTLPRIAVLWKVWLLYVICRHDRDGMCYRPC